jgi:predicted trehalose synthase
VIGAMLELDEARRSDFVPLVRAWLARREADFGVAAVEVLEVEMLLAGRPGLLDVVARVGGRLAHLVVGLHGPGAEVAALRGEVDGIVLGEYRDDRGTAVAVDALWDAELAPLMMIAISGEEPSRVSVEADDDTATVLDVDERCSFSVFPWLSEGPHPAVDMLVTLDEVGFNHLAAPIALWRRQGRDLGLVQDRLAESADGWALALTSLRDLYGSGTTPERAGGDFAIEAGSLGTMTARLHLAADKAFGRRSGAVADWSAEVEAAVQAGGVDAAGHPRYRSALTDVADMLWSLGFVAVAALDERDVALRPGLEPAARAWSERNRRAFLSGYLSTPGIEELVPGDRQLLDALVAAFELEHQPAA